MKNLFCILLFNTIYNLNAQVSILPFNKKAPLKESKYLLIDTQSIRRMNDGNLVGILKQDRMPCIIPMEQIQRIPNPALNKEFIYKMPNLWK
ncbi:MAG: hypothetical protein IPH58_14605 [Sphingobacteriales bacterium]|jgi:hypothetical protein|nr:hypothetical protein [Sphingobacteriales bacterium]